MSDQNSELMDEIEANVAGSFETLPPVAEADPVGDIAETISRVHGCAEPRACEDCRAAARLIWTHSQGHREMWQNRVQGALAEAVIDLCWRATPYGKTQDDDVRFYLLTKGTVHRLIGAAQGAGIPAAFRAVPCTPLGGEVDDPGPRPTYSPVQTAGGEGS